MRVVYVYIGLDDAPASVFEKSKELLLKITAPEEVFMTHRPELGPQVVEYSIPTESDSLVSLLKTLADINRFWEFSYNRWEHLKGPNVFYVYFGLTRRPDGFDEVMLRLFKKATEGHIATKKCREDLCEGCEEYRVITNDRWLQNTIETMRKSDMWYVTEEPITQE